MLVLLPILKLKIHMTRYKQLLLLAIAFFTTAIQGAKAQSGDQLLDGIGETGMIARYIFSEHAKDWSRNNLHAKISGQGAQFVTDRRFGKVLSLKDDAFVTIPGEALTDLESLSISGWVLMRSHQTGQRFFDFGQNQDVHFFAAPAGIASQEGFQVAVTPGMDLRKSTVAPIISLNKWIYLVIVIDVPSKKLVTYIDGKQIGSTDANPSLTALFGGNAQAKQLYIGKSFTSTDPYLNALVHDFRIYRVPLTQQQVAGIYNSAQRGNNETVVNTSSKREDDLPKFAPTEPRLYNAYLTNVADISVTTTVGDLPRLPSYVKGTYRNNYKGPKVRVIWPAAADNQAVLQAGSYTITGRVAGTNFQPKALVMVKPAQQPNSPEAKLKTFRLSEVTLKANALGKETQFVANRDKFINTLSKTDPNSFLYMFRHAFGQKQPQGAKPLGVWDSQDTKLRGHATGHYLTAIAQAYASTGYDRLLQANFAKKMDEMVNTLYELSKLSGSPKTAGGPFVADPSAVPYGPGKANYDSDLTDEGIRNDYWNWGKGFISAYPPDQFIMLENGAKYGGQKTQIWAPYYTLHKILAGLLDVYEVNGNRKALEIASGMSDWVHARLSKLPTPTRIKMWNTYIAGEFGGMNEAMAHLYRITRKPEHLQTAQLFDNIRVFFGDTEHSHGLAKNVDLFRGLHANQHIPQVVGSIETYSVSKNPEYYKIADNFWYKMVNDYMYSIGGVAGARNPANAECFIAQPGTLYENGFSAGGQNETCATYNMLKLTSELFLYDQRVELMDYYERALYNHILASVAENSPANTYHVPLRPGSAKQFGNPDMTGFTCCNGTAIESNTKLQNSIYFSSIDNQSLYVNLFIPSTLTWTARKTTVTQTTNFPKADETRLTINGNRKFDLKVRVPNWAKKGFFVQINGKHQKTEATPGTYLTISRNWKNGDVVTLKMPFDFHLDPVMDQQNIASLFYGPILLAAQEPEARKDWRKITLSANDLGSSIKGDPQKLEFTVGDVVFKPFYESYGRHSVYLDVNLK